MSSEKENIELKSKEKNNTDKLNLSGQIVQQLITYWVSLYYKYQDKQAGQIQFVRVLFFNRKSDISSIIEALIALYDALGGDKGMDVLRVVGNLLCQCRLARCQGWLQERIAIACQYNLGGRDKNCT